MLFNSLNTGSTDLRDTEVQQPNTAETFSLVISSRAFSANSGQFEAGSTTTASSFLPSKPPFLFCSSIRNSIVSFSVVSLMAMVPESEWRIPTLIVSWAIAGTAVARPKASPAVARSHRRVIPLEWRIEHPSALTRAFVTRQGQRALVVSQGACQAFDAR